MAQLTPFLSLLILFITPTTSYSDDRTNDKDILHPIIPRSFTVNNNKSSTIKLPPPPSATTGTLESLLGHEQTSSFLNNIWGDSHWHKLSVTRDDSIKSRHHLSNIWSLGLFQHLLRQDHSRPWIPITDIDIIPRDDNNDDDITKVMMGYSENDLSSPVTWEKLQRHLSNGDIVVAKRLQTRTERIQRLTINIAKELCVPVMSVAGGIVPRTATIERHRRRRNVDRTLENNDVLALALEGEMVATLCRQRGDDDNCDDVILRNGDVLYIPQGAMYRIASSSSSSVMTHSIYLAISLASSSISWDGSITTTLIDNIISYSSDNPNPDPATINLSSSSSSARYLRRVVLSPPTLLTLRHSVNNNDLPQGYIKEFQKDSLEALLTSSDKLSSSEQEMMKRFEERLRRGDEVAGDNDKMIVIFGKVLNHIRQSCHRAVRTTTGEQSHGDSCIGTVGYRRMGIKGRFRRIPGVDIIITNDDDDDDDDVVVIQTNSDEREELPSRWKDGVMFALGSYGTRTSRGDYFTWGDVVTVLKGDEEGADDLIQTLLRLCVLEMGGLDQEGMEDETAVV